MKISTFEGQAPKCTPVAPSLLLSFGVQSSLGGTFLVWGAQAVIGGHGPEMPPVGRAWYPDQARHFAYLKPKPDSKSPARLTTLWLDTQTIASVALDNKLFCMNE